MANKNFVVKNGLTVGNLSIAAESGNVSTVGSLISAAVYTNNLFYANGTPYVTTGYTGSQGVGFTGSKGETGLGFTIAKSYANVAALTSDTSPTNIVAGQFAIIETGSVEDSENSRLYLWTGSAYTYVTDLSGAAGITGPQGAVGFVGSRGDVGYAGSQGDVGYTGSRGDVGYTGSFGDVGYTGSQGDVGYTGSQGDTGFVGSRGDVGYAGSQGTTGYAGSQGDVGYTGSQGDVGYTGSFGNIGYTGSQGDVGYTGSFGNTGYTGSQGDTGYIGSRGDTGYTGSKGDTGLGFTVAKSYANVAALTADTSPTGIVAGQFAIVETGDVEDPENSRLYLWTGSAYNYVTDLSGAAGITGPQGGAGYVGSRGEVGYAGSQGVAGYVGSQGDIGYTGSQGSVGYTGSFGETGYTGSQGDVGFAGSKGDVGFTGSKGDVGFTGSKGDVGFVGSAGAPNNWTVKTANYTAVSGDRIIAKTNTGSFYITLPAGPATGSSVTITDGGSFVANSVFVLSNGSTIESNANDIEIDIGFATVEFLYDGTTWQIISTAGPSGYTGSKGNPGGSGFTTYIINTSTQASANSRYIVNTNSSNVTVTLPGGPGAGDEVAVIDGTGNASIRAITIARNGSRIQGIAEDLTVQTNRAAFSLVYYDSDNGWVLTNV